jgi:hypothetical protein
MKHEVILEIHHPLLIFLIGIFLGSGIAQCLGCFGFLHLCRDLLGSRQRTDIVSILFANPPAKVID